MMTTSSFSSNPNPRKEVGRYAASSFFLRRSPSGRAVERNPGFMLILRLENAVVPSASANEKHARAEGLWITLKPWLSMFPGRRKAKSIVIRHLDLRKTLLIHHLVFSDDIILVQEKRGKGVHFIRG